MKAKPKPDDLASFTTWCPCCGTHIETPCGMADWWDHALDVHRSWLLSTHGREVISRETR